MAGLPLFVGRKDDEVEYFKREIETILKTTLSSIKLKDNGVSVQASTLGSLEALLEFLKTSNIPVSGKKNCSLNLKCVNLDSSTLQSISDLSIDEISFERQRNSNAMHSKTFSSKKIRCFLCRFLLILDGPSSWHSMFALRRTLKIMLITPVSG